MMKLLTIFVIACVCLLQVTAQAQAQGPIVCEQLNRQCLLEQARLGRQDSITKYINRDCQRKVPGWRKISRCQLERASCEIVLAGCSALTCEQVNRVVRR